MSENQSMSLPALTIKYENKIKTFCIEPLPLPVIVKSEIIFDICEPIL